MELDNTIVLRPRFQKDVSMSMNEIIEHATKIKEEVKNDLNTFLRETEYTIDSLGLEVNPVYKSTMDKLMFKKSGWELATKPKK